MQPRQKLEKAPEVKTAKVTRGFKEKQEKVIKKPQPKKNGGGRISEI